MKVALVTGAGSGIGRGVALALCGAGYAVVVTGRHQETLEETAQGSPGNGTIHVVVSDVTEPQSVENLFAETERSLGRLDLLFNNAGSNAPPVPLEDLTYEQWQRVVSTNLSGAFLCTQAAFRIMKRQDPQGGRIINNGSISAHSPRPNSAPYTASKHGVTGLTKSTSLDGRQYNIACGQIDIGNAATSRTEGLTSGVLQAHGGIAPEPRMEVEDVAGAVLYMASLPLDTNVQFMTIMATNMPFIGRG